MKLRASIAVFPMLLAACEAVPERRMTQKPVPKATEAPQSQDQSFDMTEQLRLAQAELNALGEKTTESERHLSRIRFVNDRLCKRLATYRHECPISARIFPSGLEKPLECEGNVETGTRTAPSLDVTLETLSGGGKFFLKAGNSHESVEFGPGATSALRWTSLGQSESLPPRLWELTSLKLKSATGNLALGDVAKFEIRVNGELLFDKSDLTPLTDSSSALDVRLDGILAKKRAAECIIEDEELDRLTEEGKADATAASGLSLENEEAILANLDATKAGIGTAKSKLGELNVQIAREEDRNGKLTKELTADRSVGCFARAKIETLEIQITGSHLDPVKLSPTSEQRADTGSPRKFTFRFGEQFAHTHSDEEQQSVFVNGGSILLHDLGERTIADLEYLTIEKGGVGIDSVKHCWRVFLGQRCEWRNSEKNMYRLDGITLKVNGEEFYRADGLDQTFRDGGLLWQDRNIAMNQAFRALMRRTDCPVK